MIQSIRLALVVIALCLAAAGSAHADTTYVLALHGTDQRHYPICRTPDPTGPCDETVDLPWSGKLEITVDSNADGVWSDEDVLSFDFRSSAGSLMLQGLPGSVTIHGGHVTSVDLFNFPGSADGSSYDFSGLNVGYSLDFDAGHEATDFASGVLSTVPEPGERTLFLLALACVAAAVPSRRAAPAVD